MLCRFKNLEPKLSNSTFVAPTATIIGDVRLGKDVSIWFNTILRGDVNSIRIGARTNIQDGSVLHVTLQQWPLHIGSNVTVGHGAILHGCTIEDYCLIGMGAKILDGAQIGACSLVAAGSLVREGDRVPGNSLVAGVPAIVKRTLTDEEIEKVKRSAARYVEYKNEYLGGDFEILE